jgi:enoyl-CoA hydratase
MPTFENLVYEKKSTIGYLTLNRPKALNALNRLTLQELAAAVEDAKADSGIRGLILTGAGEKAFVAGADIKEVAAVSGLNATTFARYGQSVFDAIENLGKPVIAAVNGFALGGGCELAMACTFRIAATTARFGLPEVKLGIMPGFGGTQRLPRLVGKGRALQIMLSAEPIDAHEAHRIGLVNEVVEPSGLIARAEELLRKIEANGPLAIGLCIEAVNRGLDVTQAEGLILESALFGISATSKDKAEGTTAFLEKRPPKFTGE